MESRMQSRINPDRNCNVNCDGTGWRLGSMLRLSQGWNLGMELNGTFLKSRMESRITGMETADCGGMEVGIQGWNLG